MFNDIKRFFKDLIARIKSKRPSKKTLFIVLICIILLLIPTFTAIWHVYFRADDDFESSSDITISFYDLQQDKELFYEEINEKNISDSHAAKMFYGINSTKELIAAPSQALPDPNFKLRISVADNHHNYLCYFSESKDTSYIKAQNGKLYSVDENNYANFLSSNYSTTAYPNAIAPALFTEDGANITPKSAQWNFKKANGDFDTSANVLTTGTKNTYQMHGTLDLSFSIQPSKCNVTVFECSENELMKNEIYSGDLSALSTVTVSSGAKLLFLIDAVWLQSDHSEFYGKLSYEFEAECTEHASFELSSNAVPQGEFVTIYLHGVTDPSTVIYKVLESAEQENNIFNADMQVDLSSEQQNAVDFIKYFKPKFTNSKQSLCAFFPIPIDTPKGVFSFSLSSGIATKTFTVEITDRNSNASLKLDESFKKTDDVISEDAINETKNTLDIATNLQDPGMLFATSFGHPLGYQNSVSYSYGDRFVIDDIQIEGLRSYGNFYATSDTRFASVSSEAIGKVTYVGYTRQLGNFVVIDHGM